MTRSKWTPHQAALLRRRRSLLAPMYGDECDINPESDPDYEAWLSPAERRRLAAIYDALDRIDRCGYGSCARCGSTIDHVRLESIPWIECCAPLCGPRRARRARGRARARARGRVGSATGVAPRSTPVARCCLANSDAIANSPRYGWRERCTPSYCAISLYQDSIDLP